MKRIKEIKLDLDFRKCIVKITDPIQTFLDEFKKGSVNERFELLDNLGSEIPYFWGSKTQFLQEVFSGDDELELLYDTFAKLDEGEKVLLLDCFIGEDLKLFPSLNKVLLLDCFIGEDLELFPSLNKDKVSAKNNFFRNNINTVPNLLKLLSCLKLRGEEYEGARNVLFSFIIDESYSKIILNDAVQNGFAGYFDIYFLLCSMEDKDNGKDKLQISKPFLAPFQNFFLALQSELNNENKLNIADYMTENIKNYLYFPSLLQSLPKDGIFLDMYNYIDNIYALLVESMKLIYRDSLLEIFTIFPKKRMDAFFSEQANKIFEDWERITPKRIEKLYKFFPEKYHAFFIQYMKVAKIFEEKDKEISPYWKGYLQFLNKIFLSFCQGMSEKNEKKQESLEFCMRKINACFRGMYNMDEEKGNIFLELEGIKKLDIFSLFKPSYQLNDFGKQVNQLLGEALKCGGFTPTSKEDETIELYGHMICKKWIECLQSDNKNQLKN